MLTCTAVEEGWLGTEYAETLGTKDQFPINPRPPSTKGGVTQTNTGPLVSDEVEISSGNKCGRSTSKQRLGEDPLVIDKVVQSMGLM